MPQYRDSAGKGYWAKKANREGDVELANVEMWRQVPSAPEDAAKVAAAEASKALDPTTVAEAPKKKSKLKGKK